MEHELSLLKVGLKEPHSRLVDLLLEYFRGHSERLNYPKSLSQGRAIGNGVITEQLSMQRHSAADIDRRTNHITGAVGTEKYRYLRNFVHMCNSIQ